QFHALFKVRPIFSSLQGVSAPPPFGGNQRTIVLKVRLKDLQAQGLAPGDVVKALSEGNIISPSGAITFGDTSLMVPVNSVVINPEELLDLPLRGQDGKGPMIYLKDVGEVKDATDVATGYGLVNGRASVYILVTKRSDASTLAVVNEVRNNMPRMQAVIPRDITLRFEFDQSPYITRALWGLT